MCERAGRVLLSRGVLGQMGGRVDRRGERKRTRGREKMEGGKERERERRAGENANSNYFSTAHKCGRCLPCVGEGISAANLDLLPHLDKGGG